MAESAGRELLASLRSQLVAIAADAVAQLAAAGSLDQLTPDPDWAGTPFASQVLGPLVGGPPLVELLGRLSTVDAGTALTLTLHGWDPAPGTGEPRGIAYAARSQDGVAAVVAATPGTGTGPRLSLLATGLQSAGTEVPLGGGWRVLLAGQAAGTVHASIDPTGPPELTAASPGDWIEATWVRDDLGPRLGLPGGPGVVLGSVEVGGRLDVAADGALHPGGWVRLQGGTVELVAGPLASILPAIGPIPLDLDVALDPAVGVSLGGSTTLRTRLVAGAAGRQALDLVLDLGSGPGGALSVAARATTALDVSLPGMPVELHVEDLGLTLPFAFGPGVLSGFDPAGVLPKFPGGASVDLALPIVAGSGFLEEVGGEYAGGLAVELPPLSAQAFGLLAPPHGDVPLSFLVLLGATFPPPGIQVGFGFAISGIGGVVGVNRRIDRDALGRAVADGSAAGLLFPRDPEAAGKAAISALPAIFPAARGSVVAGPMFQLDWGSGVVALSVAVLVEAAGQVRLTVLGKLVVGLPHPEAPLILLQATFAGTLDPAEPSVTFVASLIGSRIVTVPLTGDLLLLMRGGDDPTFVLSAGGFHPAFSLPRGVPPMRRLGMDLSPNPAIEMRCEAYLAITTNTVQFGARLEFVAEIAGCGIRGHLGFDTLVQWEPHLLFMADLSAGVAIEVFGETLAGIRLDLHLEGPTPWKARGRGSIDLFLFSASFDFDEEWGDPPPPALAAPKDVGGELVAAFARAEAWTVRASGASLTGIRLTAEATEGLKGGRLADPHVVISVRQRRVPLGIDIDRFDRVPVPRQRWELAGAQLSATRPASEGAELREPFALGQFVTRSDADALGAPAFEGLRAGRELVAGGATQGPGRPATLSWESKVLAENVGRLEAPGVLSTGTVLDVVSVPELELALATADVADPIWWQVPDPLATITVAEAVPLAVASTWSMQAMAAVRADGSAPTMMELQQDLGAGTAVVEAWELA